QDAYRKIRNTLRYLFGNINDFDQKKDALPNEQMLEIDNWAMQQLQKLIAEVTEANEEFTYHRVFSSLYNFCSVEMSSIYMDVLKDRMYCDAADSPSRRSGQTAMYEVLSALVRMLAPVLVHTAEEDWGAMTVKPEDVASVHLAHMPKVDPAIDYANEEAKWAQLMGLRDEVLKVLEGLRKDKIIASNQEASVTIQCDPEDAAAIRKFGVDQFAALCIVSEIKLEEGATQTAVAAAKSPHAKCQRCWNYWPSVGKDEHPEICDRCAAVVAKQ
ncbi:MAG: class I tRNA ligase family protein, partial [Phycisphaerales bacterium]